MWRRGADALAVSIVRCLWTREAPPPVLASAAVWASAPGTSLQECRRENYTTELQIL